MVDDREDVYSKAVRAGKRTYFFDVKSTRGRDLYLTITESKKHTHDDGTATYEKHKIFLYKEDFEKFLDGLRDAYDEIDRLKATGAYVQDQPAARPSTRGPEEGGSTGGSGDRYTDVDFDDLDRS
ncbi:MAG: PUR family DNA/RNA-binding protein [Flavobacteriales bacterium]|nr:PUR family DNA/RNA-binding protein [Flavobacteriales bacterium]MCB9168187.1 PUR family DNA/RNA-binding protein [Flavobacteriales bacterium]MCB9194248.1 PUR family DNA/RNA-binding protein [Flavobacteriales bacterium]